MTHFHQRLYFVKLIERFTSNSDADNTVNFWTKSVAGIQSVVHIWLLRYFLQHKITYFGVTENTWENPHIPFFNAEKKNTQLNDKECENT